MCGKCLPSVLKIALLDDHDVVRHGSCVHLSNHNRLEVVGNHARSSALIATLARCHVDVAVIDYALAEGDLQGMELLRMLRRRFPRVRLLMFSANVHHVMISNTIAAGAAGVVSKSQSLEELARAVGRVAAGHIHLPEGYRDEHAEHRLTPSEREVLQLCLSGMTVTEIAAVRNRSIKTISTQKHAAFRKLGLRTDRDLFTLRHQLAVL
ncbi:response regulator transcription factor [Stenotrophomonas oahuensis]|uniref:Response regulator transcription factor n=1 Tax=Stenotrophomonas oahuensis TaxID=3003271 RepID=A0ABY9YP46_9GAMM|nr:response regulator transcription factor [Stenotrophomonas sp. A5586]WNH51983.1 response regulator transcription factor [Stenotrophomonas sp. A5586]